MNRIKQRTMLIVAKAFALFFLLIGGTACCCIMFHFNTSIAYADSVFQDEYKADEDGHLIVSMVYDDSGSMEGEKGMYCNYTFQLFLTLFGENDELFITYMSKPRTSSNYSINNNRQARVDNLRAHKNKIFTPITAVKTAYERLLNEDSDENDIYWLIVLTDGNFYDEQNNILKQEQLNQYIETYAKTPMSNGSCINILYIGIGDDINLPNTDRENVSVLQTKEPKDILAVLDSCGDFFTECIKADKLDCVKYSVENNQLHLETKLPLSKVIVIQNNSEEKGVTSIGYDLQDLELKQTESIDIYHSYMDYDAELAGSLRGHVSYWEKEEDYIQDGINILFNSNVGEEELVVYVQPALKLDIDYYNEADELVKMNDCTLEDVLKAKLVMRRLDTNEEVEPEVLSKKFSGHIHVMDLNNRMYLAEADELFLRDISMVNEGMIISGNLMINDTYTYRIISPINLYRSMISSTTDFQYDRTELTGNKQSIKLSVTKNEKPFQRKEMSGMSVQCHASKFPPLFSIKLKINNDGSMNIVPQFGIDNLFGKIFVNWLCVWVIPQKNINFTVSMVDMSSTVRLNDSISLHINCNNFFLEIWYRIYPILMVGIIVGLIFKKRFHPHQKVYYIKLAKKGEKLVAVWSRWRRVYLARIRIKSVKLNINPFSFVPYVSDRQKCGEVMIYATSSIYNRTKSVALKLFYWKYIKLSNFKGHSPKSIAFEVDESLLKKGGMIHLEAGEYIYIKKKGQYYLYHCGKGR